MSEPFWVPLGGAGAVDYQGEWAAGTQYEAGAVVRRNGIDYLAVNPSLGTEPPRAGLSGNVVDRKTTTVEVINSVVETTMWSYTIPGGLLGSDKMLRATLLGDWLSNAGGGGESVALRAKLGGTTYCQSTANVIVLSAERKPFVISLMLMCKGATNAEIMWMEAQSVRLGNAAPAVGIGALDALNAGMEGVLASATPNKDMTADQAIALTAQPSIASASLAFRVYAAIAEVI